MYNTKKYTFIYPTGHPCSFADYDTLEEAIIHAKNIGANCITEYRNDHSYLVWTERQGIIPWDKPKIKKYRITAVNESFTDTKFNNIFDAIEYAKSVRAFCVEPINENGLLGPPWINPIIKKPKHDWIAEGF